MSKYLNHSDIHDSDEKRGSYPPRIVGHREGRTGALATLAMVR